MFNKISELISSDSKSPIIFLFGENEFNKEEAQELLIKKLVHDENTLFNFDIINGEDSQLSYVIDLCRSYPMMSEKRVVLIKRFDKLFPPRLSKNFALNSPLASYLNSPSDSTILIINSDSDALKDIYKNYKSLSKELFLKYVSSFKFPYNILLSKYLWMEFPRIYESDYTKWADERFASKGIKINFDALELLISSTKQNLRDISHEIEKILIALNGKKEITLKDIVFLTGSTREYNVFDLQKAVIERDLSKAIRILNKILSTDKQEVLIIVILSKFFINLFKFNDKPFDKSSSFTLPAKMGINKFQFNDYISASKKYSQAEIENAIISLCETDSILKSTSTDSIMLMQNLLFRIMERKNENSTLL